MKLYITGDSGIPVGTILDFGGGSVPSGFLLCNQNVSRVIYSTLFAVLGTKWGVGDGSTTFGLPPNERVYIGAGISEQQIPFVGTNVNIDNNTISAPTGCTLFTGTKVKLSSTLTPPVPLVSGTEYYVIRVSTDVISLALTLNNALAGTVIDLTSQGTGNHILTIPLTTRQVGDIGGEENHVLNKEEIAHTNIRTLEYVGDAGNTQAALNVGGVNIISTIPHNSMEPYAVVLKIIKY